MILSGLLWPLIVLAAYVVFVWYLWRETSGMSWAAREPARIKAPEQAKGAQERILFVCTHNSARSQMAEALLRHLGGARFDVASAGTAPTQVHPLAVQVMAERGVSLRSHWAKSLDAMGTRWDYVITVCDAVFERCPDFPEKTCRLHWSIEDPSRATGPRDQQLEVFRHVLDELAECVCRWLVDQTER